MHHRFLCAEKLIPSSEYLLSPEQSHHLTNVLRLGTGAFIELFDGKGKLAKGEVRLSGKEVYVKVTEVSEVRAYSNITLGFGIGKGQAVDFIFRRATELGVAAFQPLVTDHSLGAKNWNHARWERTLVEVCKQSQNAFVPQVFEPQKMSLWLEGLPGSKKVLYCDEANRFENEKSFAETSSMILLIGPEGGWSDSERELLKNKAKPMGLGPNRLRMETASLVALTLLKSYLGEFAFIEA